MSCRDEFLRLVPGSVDRGGRKALDYALSRNALTLYSDWKRVIAALAAIFWVENAPSKVPAVCVFVGIFGLQNPEDCRDERSEFSVRHKWPHVGASDEIPNSQICEGRIASRASFHGFGNGSCDLLNRFHLLRGANRAKCAAEPVRGQRSCMFR
jgi:hypothetical protein